MHGAHEPPYEGVLYSDSGVLLLVHFCSSPQRLCVRTNAAFWCGKGAGEVQVDLAAGCVCRCGLPPCSSLEGARRWHASKSGCCAFSCWCDRQGMNGNGPENNHPLWFLQGNPIPHRSPASLRFLCFAAYSVPDGVPRLLAQGVSQKPHYIALWRAKDAQGMPVVFFWCSKA